MDRSLMPRPPWAISVGTNPGATALTVIPNEPSSIANRLVKMETAAFRGGVERSAGQGSSLPRDRRDVDDAAIAALLHARNHGARHVDQPIHVGTPHALHAAGLELFWCCAITHARALYQDRYGHKPGR